MSLGGRGRSPDSPLAFPAPEYTHKTQPTQHKYEAYKKNDAREDEEELLPTSQRTYHGAGSFVSSVPAAVDLDDGTDGEDGGSPLLNSPSFRAVEATVASTGWATRTFMSGCAILLPIFVTVTVTGWLVEAVDGIFSPVFKDVFGLQIFGERGAHTHLKRERSRQRQQRTDVVPHTRNALPSSFPTQASGFSPRWC